MHDLPTGSDLYAVTGLACLAAGAVTYIAFLVTATAEAVRRTRNRRQDTR